MVVYNYTIQIDIRKMCMFHEQSQAPSDHSFGHASTIEENIQRFKKYGKIINRVAKIILAR
jgi:hypothetical protein